MKPMAIGHFGIKRHNMAEHAMNDWLMNGTARFIEL